ncbi:hypothetical protein SNE40_013202 [Patella caerulea]|uniref:Reverse transcriptase domain-containing protein n=1 Tax=Patella caerulea TaxID=87958 RepID=A0AAN8PNL7_PATCE
MKELLVTVCKQNHINLLITNNSCSDLVIPRRSHLGVLSTLSSLVETIPTSENKLVNSCSDVNVETNKIGDKNKTEDLCDNPWEPLSHLNPSQQEKVKKLLRANSEVFSRSDDDVGFIPDLQLDISLKDDIPVKQSYISIPAPLYVEVKDYITNLIAKGFIRKSKSSYSSPLVCVRKKNGELRLCVDYRKINQKSVIDSSPLPRIQDALDSLRGSRYFSLCDQGKAYHQGVMPEGSKPYTAFVTPWGHYSWDRIPFGLSGAPCAF